MNGANAMRVGLVATVVATATACASAPNPFERHDRYMAAQREAAVVVDRNVCPVVLSNRTDEQLDARYSLEGRESVLGMIPAGRSLSFRVGCGAGRIEAYAVADRGGLLGGPNEYRTVSRIDPAGRTELRFTLASRVR